MVLKGDLTVIGNRARQKVVLNISPFDAGSRPDKRARLKVIGSAQTRFKQKPLRPYQRLFK